MTLTSCTLTLISPVGETTPIRTSCSINSTAVKVSGGSFFGPTLLGPKKQSLVFRLREDCFRTLKQSSRTLSGKIVTTEVGVSPAIGGLPDRVLSRRPLLLCSWSRHFTSLVCCWWSEGSTGGSSAWQPLAFVRLHQGSCDYCPLACFHQTEFSVKCFGVL